MTSPKKFNIIHLLLIQLILTSISLSNLFAQQRIDEEMPKIILPVKSLTKLTGWAKSDFGKWYKFNTFELGNDQVLKIELAKVSYEGKVYFCFASFDRLAYLRNNVTTFGYGAKYYLFDSMKKQKLTSSDTSINTIFFDSTFISNKVIKNRPITWADIVDQITGGLPNETYTYIKEIFFTKYRYDYKLDRAQFYFGSFHHYLEYTSEIDDKYDDDFTESKFNIFGNCKDKNKNLECGYYEVSKNMFNDFFQQILK